MSKGKALFLTILCTVLAFVCLSLNVLICMSSFFISAAVFGCVWLYKYRRDAKLVAQAKATREQNNDRLLEPPAMTSKGSSRLFVPPPLNERH